MLSQHSTPRVYAHRGASFYAPENTLAAFELAARQGAPAIELDAMLTLDQAVVVIHDSTVDRTTNGQGKVSEIPLAELKKLDAGSFFDFAFRGEPIPTLDEVFEAVGGRVYINIELKNYAAPLDPLPARAAEVVRRHRQERGVLFSSFNPLALRRIRRLLPECPIGLLALPGSAGAWARSWMGRLLPYQALHPEVSDATPELIQAAHRRGQRVNVWTVDQEAQIQQLIRQGADGIITNDPPLALRALAAQYS
jgi:glycerophosphoryl diester phosphodiesterase